MYQWIVLEVEALRFNTFCVLPSVAWATIIGLTTGQSLNRIYIIDNHSGPLV